MPEVDLDRVATVEEVSPGWRQDDERDPRWGPAPSRPAGMLDPGVLSSARFRRTSLVLDRGVVWTLGFQRDEEDGRLEIGMGGAGGCSAWTEPGAGYGAAFVSRGLGRHDRGEEVWEAIRSAYVPRS